MVNNFILQWHICDACNLKCKHCYQEDKKPIQLPYNDLMSILNQYKELLEKLNAFGHINLTGGEPLCSPYFFDILDEFKKDKDKYSFCILTNGTLLDEEKTKKIASYNPKYVQVSIEGGKRTNDFVRGKGVYKKVANAIKLLKEQNIFVSVSFTATKLNYKEFPKAVNFARKCGADAIWSDRYIPLGGGEDKDFLMTADETFEYLNIMNYCRYKLIDKKSDTHVSMQRALQFQPTMGTAYSCSAGKNLLTVMENGDLVPCRRMPIVAGNLLKENMYDLYTNNSIMQQLRLDKIPDECNNCDYSENCRGGLKCLTYAVYGDLNHKDIGCLI